MSRSTLDAIPTDEQLLLADIAATVIKTATDHGTGCAGQIQVARALGLSARSDRAAQAVVTRIMPTVAEVVLTKYPGKHLSTRKEIDGFFTYRITADCGPSEYKPVLANVKCARTKLKRAKAQTPQGDAKGNLFSASLSGVLMMMDSIGPLVEQLSQDIAQEPVDVG